ncbi:M20/M25/M40 family metallo-hydrolase [bacterium]|nr:M20/M25/M40 family metallo-hydrolase [bacterium]
MKKLILTLCLFVVSQSFAQELLRENIEKHINFLASDEMKGRLTGSPEGEKAAFYISKEFEKYGLKPIKTTFLEEFEFNAPPKIAPENTFEITKDKRIWQLYTDFIPVVFSTNGEFENEVVFGGYGVKSTNYNDYEKIDVKGKFILILRGLPKNFPDSLQSFASLHYKASEAREQGAKGVIFTTGYHQNDLSELVVFKPYDKNKDIEIPVISVTRKIAQELIKKNLQELEKKAEESSVAFSGKKVYVKLKINLERTKQKASNVVGIVRGTEKPEEAIVIGGHYDHLGLGAFGSLTPDSVGQVHNGADDNASGTAGVLELARHFTKNPTKRSLIFLAFSGEEMGLLGSKAWLENPSFAKEKIVAMLNMDMIGRLKDEKLIINGVGSSEIWKPNIEKFNENYKFQISYKQDGAGPSDHASFYEEGKPVLAFFTDVHEDYHSVGDDVWKINFNGEMRVLNLVKDIAEAVGNYGQNIFFTKVTSQDPHESVGKTGFSVYVGTIPDYSYEGNEGMKLSGAKAGGPADKAGLQKGDLITNFNGREVKNIYDFMYAIQNCKANVTVPVLVKREGKEITLQVTPINKKE